MNRNKTNFGEEKGRKTIENRSSMRGFWGISQNIGAVGVVEIENRASVDESATLHSRVKYRTSAKTRVPNQERGPQKAFSGIRSESSELYSRRLEDYRGWLKSRGGAGDGEERKSNMRNKRMLYQ